MKSTEQNAIVLLPLECDITANYFNENMIDVENNHSFNTAILPEQLKDANNISIAQTFLLPDLRTENELQFNRLFADLIEDFEHKERNRNELTNQLKELKGKLALENLEMEAFQELIVATKEEVNLINRRINNLVLDKSTHDMLVKLVQEVSSPEQKENIFNR